MTNTIRPRPGFNPLMINWGGPDEPCTTYCSYCGDAFPTDDPDFVALTLFNGDGWVAEFCDHCQATWFGIQSFPEPRPQPGNTVGTRMNHFDAFELRHRRARFTRNVSVALVVAVFSPFAVLGATTFGVS